MDADAVRVSVPAATDSTTATPAASIAAASSSSPSAAHSVPVAPAAAGEEEHSTPLHNDNDDNEFADLEARVAEALAIEEKKRLQDGNGTNNDEITVEDVEITPEQLQQLMTNSLRKLLVVVPEWDESILGVYVDEDKSTAQEKFFCTLVKKEHPVAQQWLRQQCKDREGDCMYLITKQGEGPTEFNTTDHLLNTRLTPEIRLQLLKQVFLKFKEYSDAGLLVRLLAPPAASEKVRMALEHCKTWRLKRELLAEHLECTKALMPTEEQMMDQYLHRQEGGGIGVAIPVPVWNRCATAYLAEKIRLTRAAVQEVPAVVTANGHHHPDAGGEDDSNNKK